MAGRAERRAAERAAFPKTDADAAHEDAQLDKKLKND
jgi:hypothetical protein